MKHSQEDKYSQVKEEPDVFRELLQGLENEMMEEIDRMTIEEMKKLIPSLENLTKAKDETK